MRLFMKKNLLNLGVITFFLVGCVFENNKDNILIKKGMLVSDIKSILQSRSDAFTMKEVFESWDPRVPKEYIWKMYIVKPNKSQDVLYLIAIKNANDNNSKDYHIYKIFWYYDWYSDSNKPKALRSCKIKYIKSINFPTRRSLTLTND